MAITTSHMRKQKNPFLFRGTGLEICLKFVSEDHADPFHEANAFGAFTELIQMEWKPIRMTISYTAMAKCVKRFPAFVL
jgi:hypothetical protein